MNNIPVNTNELYTVCLTAAHIINGKTNTITEESPLSELKRSLAEVQENKVVFDSAYGQFEKAVSKMSDNPALQARLRELEVFYKANEQNLYMLNRWICDAKLQNGEDVSVDEVFDALPSHRPASGGLNAVFAPLPAPYDDLFGGLGDDTEED